MAAVVTQRRTPPINAELTGVYTVERTSDGGGGWEDGELVEKWSGTVPAFTTEKNAVEVGGGAVMNTYTAQVVIPHPLGSPPVAVEVGDVLEYVRHGATETRRVDSTEDRSDFGFTRCFVSEPD